MELLQLKYFRTVARMESVTRAANYYHIPQSAMSQTISRLEKELGTTLFDRHNNRIHLNSNGRVFLEYTNKALLELENGIQAVTNESKEISGAINLLAIENRRFVLSCVERFAEENPDVNLSISHDYYGEYELNYDLIITSSPPRTQNYSFEPCIKERIVLNIHESHPFARRTELNLSELQDERFISMTSRSSLFSITYDSCHSCGFEPFVPFICDDPYFVRKYVSEKMGIALVPEVSWEGRFRENTRLVKIVPEITTTSYIAWDNRRYLSPAINAFRAFLLDEAVKLPNNLIISDQISHR